MRNTTKDIFDNLNITVMVKHWPTLKERRILKYYYMYMNLCDYIIYACRRVSTLVDRSFRVHCIRVTKFTYCT